jgi:threonine/homoserine/homoserine lactone efflux protein
VLAAFLIASVILAITPGPGVLYIVTRSLTQGRRFGLASVAGVALGNLGNAVGASIGLAAVFAVSAIAFTAVKYLGALYLVYLGLQAIRAARPAPAVATPSPASLQRIFRDGFIVALLNPKTAIFFAAFLSQFMNAESPAIVQSLTLGSVFVAVAAATDTGYALAAGALAPVLTRARGVRAFGRYLTGGAFIGLGIYTVARS